MSRTQVRRVAIAMSSSTLAASCLLLAAPASANPAGTAVVISEAYVNGGSTGASYRNKFVELYNPSPAAISLTGTSLQYRAPASTVVPSGTQVYQLSGTVAPHGHFLIQLPGNGAGSYPGAELPTPDLSTGTSVNPGAGGGTLYIAASTSGVPPTDGAVIDRIGWGTSNAPEATAATGNSLVASLQRDVAGTDTDNNATDLRAGAPTPQNAAADGATDPVVVPDPEVVPDPAAAVLPIAAIQGTNTGTSPYAEHSVTTEGVVTAVYPSGGFNGFYLQTGGTGVGDATPGASDAIFVFGSTSVSIGQSVRVSGTVREYQGLTEIVTPVVDRLDTPLAPVVAGTEAWSDLATDAQKEAHEGELIAPQGQFTVSGNFDTNWYGSILLAAGDTALRQPTDAAAAGSDKARAVAADNAARAVTLDDGSSWNYGSGASTGRPMPWLTPGNPVRVGSTVTFQLPLILDYRYSRWNLQPTRQVTDDGAAVATFTDTRAGNLRPGEVGGAVRLATFNVENYFPTTGQAYIAKGLGTCSFYDDRAGNHIGVKTCTGTDGSSGPRGAADDASFARQQAKAVTGINRLGAGIVSLEEVENSVRFGGSRDDALAALVAALNAAAGANVWAYVPSPPGDQLPPLAEQDVIRTAFIYQPSQVEPVGAATVLTGDSGAGQPFSIARQPLAQGFKRVGSSDADAFLVVANHWKSKGSGTPLYDGDLEDTSSPAVDQGSFNAARVRQAQDTSDFAARRAAAIGTDRIFLLGDFNTYTQEDPLRALYARGYTNLGATLDPTEATYSYNGMSGSLDHVLANPAARAMVTGADVWQINAQESVAYAYSRYNYNATLLFDGTDPFAASDHNPVIVGFNPPVTPPAWDAAQTYGVGDTASYQGSTWQALWWTSGQTPGDPNGPWQQMVTAADGTAVWTASRVFVAGDVVVYEGQKYVAQWWTRNQVPGQPYGPWVSN